jgi:hypothetical protein
MLDVAIERLKAVINLATPFTFIRGQSREQWCKPWFTAQRDRPIPKRQRTPSILEKRRLIPLQVSEKKAGIASSGADSEKELDGRWAMRLGMGSVLIWKRNLATT